MEQTNTPQQPSRKKAILSLLVLLALTCVVVFIFSSHWAEISTALAQLSFWQVLLVLAIGLTYPLLEGIVCWLIIRCRLPGFTLRRGMDAAFVGIFGNVVGLGAGAVPMESYYLYHCGLPLGPGVGLMTLQYVFHKTTVLLYATVMLLLQHRWLAANTSGVMHYLPAAYCVVALVIVTLVLLCVSPLVQRLARWAMSFLPKTEPWQTRREKWLEQLETAVKWTVRHDQNHSPEPNHIHDVQKGDAAKKPIAIEVMEVSGNRVMTRSKLYRRLTTPNVPSITTRSQPSW